MNRFVEDLSDSALVQGSKEQKKDTISHSGSINRTKLRLADSLTPHRRTYCIARAIHIAYGKLFGRAHMLPNTYIIGFAKCGTTSLYTYLIEHPQIHASFTKEIHYFDYNERFKRGKNWYRSNFPLLIQKIIYEQFKKKKFVSIDATPRYINHPHAMRRIKKITPNAKFIVIVRNPIERAYSHYNMTYMMQQIPEELTFSESIKNEESRVDGEYEKMERDESYYSTQYFGYAYAQRGLYVKWLKVWLDEFSNNVLVLDNDSLIKNLQLTIDKITDFLEIERYKLSDTGKRNVGNYIEDIDDSTLEKLSQYYAKPNAQLYSLLGQNFGWDKA